MVLPSRQPQPPHSCWQVAPEPPKLGRRAQLEPQAPQPPKLQVYRTTAHPRCRILFQQKCSTVARATPHSLLPSSQTSWARRSLQRPAMTHLALLATGVAQEEPARVSTSVMKQNQ